MPDARTIYQQSVVPLTDEEKLRLATIILQHLSSNGENEPLTAFDLLHEIQIERVFPTARDVDEHLQTERESWEN